MSLRLDVCFAVLVLALPGAPAWAQVDQPKIAAAGDATAAFLALAKGSEVTGKVPRQTDPQGGALLDKIEDLSALGTTPLSMTDVNAMITTVTNCQKVVDVYVTAGTGQTDPAALESDEKATARSNLNIADFAPEVGRATDCALFAEGKLAETLSAWLPTVTPAQIAKQQGLADAIVAVKHGIAENFSGVLTTISNASVDEAWRRDRLKALIAVAQKAAPILLPQDAAGLEQQAKATATLLGQVQSDVQSFQLAVTK